MTAMQKNPNLVQVQYLVTKPLGANHSPSLCYAA